MEALQMLIKRQSGLTQADLSTEVGQGLLCWRGQYYTGNGNKIVWVAAAAQPGWGFGSIADYL